MRNQPWWVWVFSFIPLGVVAFLVIARWQGFGVAVAGVVVIGVALGIGWWSERRNRPA